MKSRRKRRGRGGCAVGAGIALVLILIGALAVGIWAVRRYTPSKKMADKASIFQVKENQVAILLNDELQSAKGIYAEGQVYLPISWVNEAVNERFYWDEEGQQVIYTLPESLVYAGTDTIGESGHLIQVKNGEAYLSLGLIGTYTDIREEAFDTSQVKRVFIDSEWGAIQKAKLKKNAMVRVKGGVKSDIVVEAKKGDTVTILEAMDRWSKVRTADGYIGYVKNRRLQMLEEETPVSTFEAPVYTNISLKKPVVAAFHQVFTKDANKQLVDRLSITGGVDVVIPSWFVVTDTQGNYSSIASKDYVYQAHARGVQVWAMLNNVSTKESVAVDTKELMSSAKSRKKMIDKLMAEAQMYGFDGVNLDFEGIRAEAGPHYVQFIRELSVECRKNKLVLSVDNYVPTVYSEFYNRKEQGAVADYLIVMGYDEHYAGGEKGSVASIGFTRQGIADTLKLVDKDKVIWAVPFYTRVWSESEGKSTSKAYGITSAKKWVQDNGVELTWDENLGQYYGETTSDSGSQYIWMEEERSLGLKIDEIKKNDLAGVACWKLGFEDAAIWDVVNGLRE